MANGTIKNPNSIAYKDITYESTDGVVAISASTNYVVSQDNFLNAIVRDANLQNINVYTYRYRRTSRRRNARTSFL